MKKRKEKTERKLKTNFWLEAPLMVNYRTKDE